ncbi:MAG: serine protein kinase PrkA [Deltaproteobacteria bacterium]|nr:MAG: serine protein kinase PrkA [Deltaproteobacteria bacterium]
MNIDWVEEANKDEESLNEILSFQDYMDKFYENPYKECRPTYEYLIDMLNHYGKDEKGRFKLYELNHPDAPPVYGQLKTQQALYENLVNFREEGFNNKFILLVGPNGSSKSSMIRKFMKGAEEYSKTHEGCLYSFSWIFPIENYVKGTLGLNQGPRNPHELNTFAYLDDKDVNAILPSELKDHPILLIPKKYRQNIIDESLIEKPDLLDSVRKSYLYKGDLSKRNRMIYDALLKNYKGKHSEVLKHIRIERFNVSKRYSSAAVTIEPQIHVDARMQQITMDKRLASLPPSLQSLNLFSLQGEVVLANRGILEYSDLLKRPLDTYKYLLMTMETSNINLQGILTELDIFFVGTSNEIHLAAFKQHPDFNSFKGRFNFVRVPYLLNFIEEQKIYEDQILGLADTSVLEPHSLEALCLFAVLTRLRSPQSKNYPEKKLNTIVTSMNPLEKARFIAEDYMPDRLDSESKQILKQHKEEVLSEFEYENLYEGKFGISPRDMKNIIYKLTNRHENMTFVEILDYLQKLILKKNEYDFLNMTPQADYHHPARFIALIKEFCLDQFDHELRDSLGMIDDRSYEDYIKKYIENVNAMIKGEKIKNPYTGKYEDSDEYFIKEFEKNISLKEDPKTFRSHLISKLGAFFLDNPGVKIVYTDVFPELIQRLKESFRNEQKKVIQGLTKNIVFYEAEVSGKNVDKVSTPLSEENRKQIENVVNNLVERYKYTPQGALTLLKYTIKERY